MLVTLAWANYNDRLVKSFLVDFYSPNGMRWAKTFYYRLHSFHFVWIVNGDLMSTWFSMYALCRVRAFTRKWLICWCCNSILLLLFYIARPHSHVTWAYCAHTDWIGSLSFHSRNLQLIFRVLIFCLCLVARAEHSI